MDFPDTAPPYIYEQIAQTQVPQDLFPSNYTFKVQSKSFNFAEKGSKSLLEIALKTKQQAFETMDRLQGWCSKEKAALLIDIVLACQPTIIVEIGVFGGKSLIPMAYAMKALKNKGLVFGIDPWKADKSAEGMDPISMQWWLSVDHENILNNLLDQVYASDLEETIRLLRVTSEDSPPIPNIGLLHIDGNHSAETSIIDVTKWVPLVKKGGIIIFDDVNWATTNAATEWLDKRCEKIAEYRGENIWGVWIKRK